MKYLSLLQHYFYECWEKCRNKCSFFCEKTLNGRWYWYSRKAWKLWDGRPQQLPQGLCPQALGWTSGHSLTETKVMKFTEVRTQSGFCSPSWATWLKIWRSSPWQRSVSSPCPSGSLKLIDSFLGHCSRMRFWRSCLCKGRPTRLVGPTLFFARLLAIVALCSCNSFLFPEALALSQPHVQEAAADGWHQWLLCFSHLWCHLQDAQLSDLWSLERVVFIKSSYQACADHLVKTHIGVSLQGTQALAITATQGFYTRKIKRSKLGKKMENFKNWFSLKNI